MKRIYLILPCLALTAFAGASTPGNAPREPAACPRPPFQLDPYADRDGALEAKNDISSGRLRVLSFGLTASWTPEYREILRRDYGIECDSIAGCVVSEGLMKYAAAYNQAMRERITRLHGPDVFATAAAQAQKMHAEKDRPAARE